jgi:DNA (cytosine-5)-methyltransferase 1
MYPNSGNPQAGRIYDAEGICPTMDTCSGGNRMPKVSDDQRIRKLTPKECFRLMGFDDEAFHKAEAVNSNSQLYKQAGNSIVVDVLEAIFRMMLDENGRLRV